MFASLYTVTANGVHMDNQSLLTFYMPTNLQDASRCASFSLFLCVKVALCFNIFITSLVTSWSGRWGGYHCEFSSSRNHSHQSFPPYGCIQR